MAPRPANTPEPRTFEPAGIDRSNRYLEFADIALGVKKPSPHKKKVGSTAGHSQRDRHPKSNVTSIDSHKSSNPRTSNEGFGAFRNPR